MWSVQKKIPKHKYIRASTTKETRLISFKWIPQVIKFTQPELNQFLVPHYQISAFGQGSSDIWIKQFNLFLI